MEMNFQNKNPMNYGIYYIHMKMIFQEQEQKP